MSAPRSSWISRILYRNGFLAILLTREDALLYAGVPSWIPGLLCAGTGRRSPGLAYNKLVKGQYQYQRVTGRRKVGELVTLMNVPEQLQLPASASTRG